MRSWDPLHLFSSEAWLGPAARLVLALYPAGLALQGPDMVSCFPDLLHPDPDHDHERPRAASSAELSDPQTPFALPAQAEEPRWFFDPADGWCTCPQPNMATWLRET